MHHMFHMSFEVGDGARKERKLKKRFLFSMSLWGLFILALMIAGFRIHSDPNCNECENTRPYQAISRFNLWMLLLGLGMLVLLLISIFILEPKHKTRARER